MPYHSPASHAPPWQRTQLEGRGYGSGSVTPPGKSQPAMPQSKTPTTQAAATASGDEEVETARARSTPEV